MSKIELDVMKPHEFLAKILKDNLLYSGVAREFSSRMVSKVVELMCAADFEEDEILIHQGAEGDAFYVMECGAFDISVMKQEEEEEEVEEGDHLIVQQKQNKLALTLQASLSYEVHAKQQQTQPYYDTIGAMDPPKPCV
eukprot:1132733_1